MRLFRVLAAAGSYYVIAAVTIVTMAALLLIGNQLAQIYLRSNPYLLMTADDRINENTRAVREKMIPPEKATLWYDLRPGDDVKAMWDEFYNAGVMFQSYVHFRSRPLMGKYYGVTEAGYRLTREPGPWPPDPANLNVFFFGGSTSFGVGPYWATVASYLQDSFERSGQFKRKVYVYNFGRSGYISSQEVTLFSRLLSAGYKPDMAVFLDGLNDFCFWDGQPSSWGALAAYFNQSNDEYRRQTAGYGVVTQWGKVSEFLRTLPLLRLVNGLLFQRAETIEYKTTNEPPPDKPESEAVLRQVIDRYIANMRQVKAVSEAYGIVPVFVWQPIPTHKYDVSHHVFNPNRLGCHINSKVGYPMMETVMRSRPLGDSFIWAADMQQDLKEPLYVDAFHYTAPMSKRIAEFIFEGMLDRDKLRPLNRN
ncbi:MAG: hypothetical protein AB7E67_06485 [Xanthobacteraceae bacterium]